MSNPEAAASRTNAPVDKEALPSLYADRSFWGMTITQFLGAFNDNLFKQLILLLSISTVGASALGEEPGTVLLWFGVPLLVASASAAVGPIFFMIAFATFEQGAVSDGQATVMFVFAAPFLAFTGYAGYLSDKIGKRGIVISCKVAEIIIMALGGLSFVAYSREGTLLPLLAVLFLMGAQSAFFGPAKYGILPEMLRVSDLPRANGFMLMTTFLAIIFGTVVAGKLLESSGDELWRSSIACVVIAVVGTVSSFLVRRVPPANPNLEFDVDAVTVPQDMRSLLASDRPLLMALLVSSVFWLLAGMVPSAVNALGKIEMRIGDDHTSELAGIIGVGIALGCVVGGLVSGGKVDFRLLRIGSIGMLVCLILMAVPASGDMSLLLGENGELARLPGLGEGPQWLGYWGSLPTLLLLGVCTGLFAVPLQVFMQSRPPDDKKGRMIAVMNQANWVGILISAGLYWMLSKLIESNEWPRSTMFLFIGLLMLPIVLFYRPKEGA